MIIRKILLNTYLTLALFSLIHAQERTYEIYGFAQLDFQASTAAGSTSGFEQKRLNLIGEYFLENRIRFLSDIEFEGGTDIAVNDSSSYGLVKISRAWVEYTVAPQLKLRAGKMLTPFGLYNLIHDASASYFPVDPPLMYSKFKVSPNGNSQRLYSKYFIGLEATGTFELDKAGSQLEYSVGIGNGRGLTSDGADLNNNRAILSRLMYRPSFFTGSQFGLSFYTDKNYYGIDGVRNDNEYAYAFDFQYEDSYLQIQSEFMLSDFENNLGERQTAFVSYLQAAYTLWDVLTPFANYSKVLFDLDNHDSGFNRINFGVNWAVSPYLFLKSEIQFHSTEEEMNAVEDFIVYKATIAVAF
jgi:hypothetical protein